MCKAVEDIRNMGIQQGMQQGVQQGKQKGIQEIVLTMLKKGKTCEEISDLTDIPLETVTLIQSEG
jgi:predicted transposase/invertase (TIGR01784 family)